MKIKNMLFGILILLSMVTSVVAMPAVQNQATQVAGPISALMQPVVFMSEGSNTMSKNLGYFQVDGTNFGSFTGMQYLMPGVYTVRFIPKAGFTFDKFVLSGNVQIYSQNQQTGSVPDSVNAGQEPSADMIDPNSLKTYPSITVQVTGTATIKAYAYDVQAPTVAIHSSTASQITAGNTFTVYATANDNDVMAPLTMRVTINGQTYGMNYASGLYSYAVTGLSAGTYSYTVEAKDAAHNANTASGSVTVAQPANPPSNGGNTGGNTGGSTGGNSGSYTLGTSTSGSSSVVSTTKKTSVPVAKVSTPVATVAPVSVYNAEPVEQVSTWKSTVAKLVGLNLILLIILLIVIFGMR